MPITVNCACCEESLQAPDYLGGCRIRCPECDELVQLPVAPDTPPQPDTVDASAHLALPEAIDKEHQSAATPDPTEALYGTRRERSEPLRAWLAFQLKAWLPSFGVHLFLVILLGLVTFSVRPLNKRDREVPVAIVMRDVDEDGKISYRDENDVGLGKIELTREQVPFVPPDAAPTIASLAGGGSEGDELDQLGLGGGGQGAGMGTDVGDFLVGAGTGGGGGGANFFGVSAGGSKFIYIVDRSGSMQGKPFDTAKEHLIHSIRRLRYGAKVHVYFFSSGAYLQAPAGKLVRRNRKNLAELETWIKSVGIGGGTDPRGALMEAIKLRPHAIFLLTDGQFDVSIARHAAALNTEKRVKIHTIGFLSQGGAPVLRAVARLNGGTYKYVAKAGPPEEVSKRRRRKQP